MPKQEKYDNGRIARNTLFLYIRMIFILIVSLYTSRVILTVLGVVDFGVYSVVAGFVTMFSFLNASLVGAIQRYYNYEKSNNGDDGIQNVYNTSLRIQIFLAIVVLLLLESIGLWYLNNVMVIPSDRMVAAQFLYQSVVLSAIIVILQIPYSAAIVSFERMDFYAFVGIIDIILKLLIVILLPFLQYDKLIIYSFLLFLVSIIDFLLYFFYAKTQFNSLVYVRKTTMKLLKPMLSFSGWNVIGTFAALAYTQGLNLILNVFYGPIVNAANGLANMVMSAIHGFSINVTVAFRPQLIESYANNDYDKTREIMFSESRICFIMLYMFVLPVVLEIDKILEVWLGVNVPEHTALFTILVLIQMLVSAFNPAFTQVIHATGNLKNFQVVTSIIALSVIPGAYFILSLGCDAYMVFIVSIIWQMITALVCMILVRKVFEYDVRDFIKTVILPSIFVALISPALPLLCIYYMPSSFIRLVVVSIVSIICTLSISYLCLLRVEEKVFIKRKVKPIFNNILSKL